MDVGGFELPGHQRPGAHLRLAPPPAEPRVWTVFVGYVVLWLAAVLTTTVVALAAAAIVTGGDTEQLEAAVSDIVSRPSFVLAASATVSFWCLVIPALASWMGGQASRERLRTGPVLALRPGRTIILAVIATIAVSQAAASVLSLTGLDARGTLAEAAEVVASLRGPVFLGAVLVLAVLAPIAEEVFFRGFVQTRLRARWGAARAVVVASALFGLLHADPIHSSVAFIIGLVLGWSVETTGSIRPAIWAHVTNNLLWVTSLELPFAEPAPAAEAAIAAACAVAAALAVFAAMRAGASTRGHRVH